MNRTDTGGWTLMELLISIGCVGFIVLWLYILGHFVAKFFSYAL